VHKGLGIFCFVMAGLTAVAAVPGAIFIGLIFLVIPGLILIAAPNLLIVGTAVLVGLAAFHRLGRIGSVVAPLAILLGVAVALPAYLNRSVNAELKALSEGDRDWSGFQSPPQTLALLVPQSSPRDTGPSDCADVCQRLLYNGSVQAVVAGPSLSGSAEPAYREDAGFTRYRIERRPSCPAVKIVEAGHWQGETRPGALSHGTRVSDQIKARIAGGECLIAEPAGIAEADAIVIDRSIRHGKNPYFAPGQINVDTVTARRLSVHRREAGVLREVFRQTSVQAEPISPILFVGVSSHCSSGACNTRLDIGRWPVNKGRYDLPSFFKSKSGLNVGLIDELPNAARARLLREALADPSLGTDAPRLQLVDGYLKNLGEKGPNGSEDIDLVRSTILDGRTRGFFHLERAVRKLGEPGAALAEPLMQLILTDRRPHLNFGGSPFANAFAALPPKAARAVMPQLRALADDKFLRRLQWAALVRLSDDGAASVPVLLKLIEAGNDAPLGDIETRNLSIAGLKGLCWLGPEGAEAAPVLLAIVSDRTRGSSPTSLIPLARLAVAALVRMGKESELEQLFPTQEELKRQVAWQVEQNKRGEARGFGPERVCSY
jgi:hypothetical protein